MKLELEQYINSNDKLKDTLDRSIKVRRDSEIKNEDLVKKSKQERIENIDKPFNTLKYHTGKLVNIPLRNLMALSTRLSGAKKIILNKYKHIKDGKPVIFVSTHTSKYDIELVFQTMKTHAHLLSGTEDRMLGSLEGKLLGLNGINYVDRANKEDRNLSVRKMDKDLKNGVNLLVFPEGTLNLSENILIQPISYSLIDLAIRNDAAIELVSTDKSGKQLFTNYGGRFNLDAATEKLKPMYDKIDAIKNILINSTLSESEKEKYIIKIAELEKLKKEYLIIEASRLRDSLATLKWETMIYKEEYLQTKIKPKEYNKREYVKNDPNWDYNYYTKRSEISEDFWPDTLSEILEEWLMADLMEESDYIFKPKGEAYEFFEEFNCSEKEIDGKILRKRISSEGRQKRK